MGEKFLLDSVIDAYNSEHTDNTINKEKNLTSGHIKELNIFVNNPKNHDSIKTDMYEKDLQNKANYGNLIYGGYTMEPAGPDCMTSNLQRRIPEGHYKGIYHYSNARYKRNTMNLYSDMVRYTRYILVHAGIQNMIYTTGCVLVSGLSYEKTYEKEYSFLQSKDKKDLLYQLYKIITNESTNKLYKHINVVIRNKFGIFGE